MPENIGIVVLGVGLVVLILFAFATLAFLVFAATRRPRRPGRVREPEWLERWEQDLAAEVLRDLRRKKAREQVLDEMVEAHDEQTEYDDEE